MQNLYKLHDFVEKLNIYSKSHDLPIKKKFSQDSKIGLKFPRSWEKSQGVATLKYSSTTGLPDRSQNFQPTALKNSGFESKLAQITFFFTNMHNSHTKKGVVSFFVRILSSYKKGHFLQNIYVYIVFWCFLICYN